MLNNIQVLRALAAYLIVCAHMNIVGLPFTEQMFPGVDIFFVISGFVIVYSTTNRPETPAAFMRKRIVRIVPLYWTITLLLTACAIILPDAMNNTRPDLTQLLKSLLFIAYDKHDGMVRPLLAPGWTLNLEMLFYAIFAATLFLRTTAFRVIAASGFLAVLVALGFALRPSEPVLAFYTSSMLGEFAFGMLFGLLHRRITIAPPPRFISIAVGVAGVVALVAPGVSTEGPWRLLVPGLPAAALVFSALALEAGGVRCESRNLLLLGRASYSLYLTHLFVIVPVSIGARYFNLVGPLEVATLAALILVLATALALICHARLDEPVTGFVRKLVERRPSSFRAREQFIEARASLASRNARS